MNQTPPGYSDLFFDLSTATSTIGHFQVIDLELLENLKKYFRNEVNIFRGENSINLQHQLREKYPVILQVQDAEDFLVLFIGPSIKYR